MAGGRSIMMSALSTITITSKLEIPHQVYQGWEKGWEGAGKEFEDKARTCKFRIWHSHFILATFTFNHVHSFIYISIFNDAS